MILEERLDKLRARLMLEHPFFGALSTTLNFKQSDDIANFEIKNQNFIYNDEYISDLNDDELLFCLANGALHQASHHKSRKMNRSSWLWHLATDYTINSILAKSGFSLPKDINYEEIFDDMYAEEVYEELRSRFKHKDEEEKREDSNKNKESEYLDRLDKTQLDELIEAIIQKYQKQDMLPRELDRITTIQKLPKISWRDILYRYINFHLMSDYRLNPPNKKFLYLNYALASVYGQKLEIAVAIDTSASIDDELLGEFLGEFQAIMSAFDDYEITLIECDDKIQNISTIRAPQDISSQLKGGGGTDFRAVFEYLEKINKEIKFLIYFTDGKGIFPTAPPRFDTLWVTPSDIKFPFGEVLKI